MAGVLLAAPAFGQVMRTPDGGYLLRVRYQKGELIKYMTVTTVNSSSMMRLKTPILMKVKDANKSKYLVSLTVGPMTLGNTQMQPAQTHDIMINSRNGSDSSSQFPMVSTTLPKDSIKVGETWSTSAPIPDIAGESHTMNVTYRFQGVKNYMGKAVAVITYSLTGDAVGSGKLIVLASDGTIFSNSAKMTFAHTAAGKMSVSMEMTRG